MVAADREIGDAHAIGDRQRLGMAPQVDRALALGGDQELGVSPGSQDQPGRLEEAGEARIPPPAPPSRSRGPSMPTTGAGTGAARSPARSR